MRSTFKQLFYINRQKMKKNGSVRLWAESPSTERRASIQRATRLTHAFGIPLQAELSLLGKYWKF